MPIFNRFMHCPWIPSDVTWVAAGGFLNARIVQHAASCILALAVLCWIGAFGGLKPAIADSTRGIRTDGQLDFISSEGRVLASIRIEIAETPQARAIGLMGRRGLDDSAGMLFVHERVGVKSFWMRNTPTSLDIIFVSENSRVIHIAANTKPMSDTIYSSKGPALYVVEVLSGFCARYGIVEGARITWQRN